MWFWKQWELRADLFADLKLLSFSYIDDIEALENLPAQNLFSFINDSKGSFWRDKSHREGALD